MTSDRESNRHVIRTVRLSDAEVEAIERRMAIGGYRSFSAYARDVMMNAELKVTTVAFDPRELRAELARIGNNLNQIARRTNMENALAAREAVETRRLAAEIQRLLTSALDGAGR